MSILEIIQDLFLNHGENFVNDIYREFLEETPSSKVVRYYMDFMESGAKRHEVLHNVVSSDDFEDSVMKSQSLLNLFKLIMKKDGYEFIKCIHSDLFSEELLLTELQEKAKLLKNGLSKEQMLKNNLLNEKFMVKIKNCRNERAITLVQEIMYDTFKCNNNYFVVEIFKEFLNRRPTRDELMSCRNLSKLEIYNELINSEEFSENLNNICAGSCLSLFQELLRKDDELFVAEVYRQCLGREADPDGFHHHVNLLRSGTSKTDIFRIILISNEASELYYKKVLNKQDSTSSKSSELWTDVPLSKEYRLYVQKLLVENKMPFSTNILVKTGGLGDFIQMTPVAKALKKKDPTIPVVAIVGYNASIFDEHPYIDLAIECGGRGLHEVIKSVYGLTKNVFDIRYVSRAYGSFEVTDYFVKNKWYYDHFPPSGTRVEDLNMNVCDIALHSLGLEKYATSDDVCITPEEVWVKIPGDYVVVCDTSGSGAGQMKRWTAKEWNGLINWLVKKDIIPVQIGQKNDELLHPSVMDLRGETSPRQAAGYLKGAKAYIGLEGGLFHLAKAVKTPAIVIFATTSEVCFAYSDTKVMSKKLCHPCWWTDTWLQAKCLRGCDSCINLPNWQDVADEVSKLLT
jgi:ADP-heptose:LPS heptosyltransferase